MLVQLHAAAPYSYRPNYMLLHHIRLAPNTCCCSMIVWPQTHVAAPCSSSPNYMLLLHDRLAPITCCGSMIVWPQLHVAAPWSSGPKHMLLHHDRLAPNTCCCTMFVWPKWLLTVIGIGIANCIRRLQLSYHTLSHLNNFNSIYAITFKIFKVY